MAWTWNSFVSAWGAAVTAFRKEIITPPADTLSRLVTLEEWGAYPARRDRYAFFWSYYDGTAYDNVHLWANKYKADYALYRNIRACYSPLFRLGNFWATHVWNGRLDASKQDGKNAPSGLPIDTTNDAIRDALTVLWRDSNFATNKELIPRLGAVKGDVAIKIEDDPAAGKVRLHPVDASVLSWVGLDNQGNVDGYDIVDRRPDPRPSALNQGANASGLIPLVDYVEQCRRDGKTIHYRTLLNNEPYPWNGVQAEWSVDYGFVPMVLIQHMKVLPDYAWGWSEFQGALTKTREADHVGSNLHTQIRKASDPRYFIAGARPPAASPKVQGADSTSDRPHPEEAELPFIYGGIGSACHALVYPLDIQFTSQEIQFQLQALEKDFPELRFDSARASGDASAKALREVRKSAEAKVHARRVGYDDALVRAQKMALSIGGFRGYPGYEAFPVGAYEAGDLDHSIGERTVFLMDPLDRTEEEQALMTAWQTAKNAGVPDEIFMARNGFTDAEIKDFLDARVREQNLALAQAQALALIQAQAQVAARAQLEPPPSQSAA